MVIASITGTMEVIIKINKRILLRGLICTLYFSQDMSRLDGVLGRMSQHSVRQDLPMNSVSILCIVGWLVFSFLQCSTHLSENTRCAGQKHPQKGRADLEPGEQHARALLIEAIVGEMVSKQLFFDPDLEIEDKPQGKEGDQAQPAEGNKEQAGSRKKLWQYDKIGPGVMSCALSQGADQEVVQSRGPWAQDPLPMRP